MMLRWYLLIDIIIRRFWLTWHNPPVAIKSHIDKWNHASVWTTWGRSWYPLCTELQWMFLSPENERISANNWWLDDIFFWNGPFSGDVFFGGEGFRNQANAKLICRVVFLPETSMISTIIVVLTPCPRWSFVCHNVYTGPWWQTGSACCFSLAASFGLHLSLSGPVMGIHHFFPETLQLKNSWVILPPRMQS